MEKIKIFKSHMCTDDLENKISDWVEELKPEIKTAQIAIENIIQYNASGEYNDSWTEYVAIIIYKTTL